MKSMLQTKLDNLWGATIDNYTLDILNNCFKLNLVLPNNGISINHTLNILNITALYFLNDYPESRHNLSDWEYLELTTIEILPAPVSILYSDKRLGNQNNSTVNMYMEIWNQVIYLESDSIEIDGFIHKITY